jgi:hypothetical protein
VLYLSAVPPDPPDALLARGDTLPAPIDPDPPDALLARGDTLLAPIGPDPPDELPHYPQPAGGGDGAGLRSQVPGDQPDQRGLPGAVRAHQRGDRALADPE